MEWEKAWTDLWEYNYKEREEVASIIYLISELNHYQYEMIHSEYS